MNTTIFQETSNLYHILKPIIGRRFQKLFSGVHFGAVSLIYSALGRNAATPRKVLAPFSLSHVIECSSFFFSFSYFFSRSFLFFMVTSD